MTQPGNNGSSGSQPKEPLQFGNVFQKTWRAWQRAPIHWKVLLGGQAVVTVLLIAFRQQIIHDVQSGNLVYDENAPRIQESDLMKRWQQQLDEETPPKEPKW